MPPPPPQPPPQAQARAPSTAQQLESATTRAAAHVRWCWLRALWWTCWIEAAAWWIFVALALISYAHSQSARLAFWLNVVTTLPLCWLASRYAGIVEKPPPPRTWIIVYLSVEAVALVVNVAQVVVRSVWLQCKASDTAALCRVYPEHELALVGLVVTIVLVLSHLTAVIFCALVLAQLSKEVKQQQQQRRGTGRDVSSSSQTSSARRTNVKPLSVAQLL